MEIKDTKYLKVTEEITLGDFITIAHNDVTVPVSYGYGVMTSDANVIYKYFKHLLNENNIQENEYEEEFYNILTNKDCINIGNYDSINKEYNYEKIDRILSQLLKKYQMKHKLGDIRFFIHRDGRRTVFYFGRLYKYMNAEDTMLSFYEDTYKKLTEIFEGLENAKDLK